MYCINSFLLQSLLCFVLCTSSFDVQLFSSLPLSLPSSLTLSLHQVPKGIFLECIICTLEYGMAAGRIPRVLNCGHTFCTECLQQCMRIDTIPCPFCSQQTRVIGDIRRVPMNFSILEMLQPMHTQHQQRPVDLCEACEEIEATIICLSCSAIGVKFCTGCDDKEHNRNFRPVQLHKRIPLSKYLPQLTCTQHTGVVATMFSEAHNQFACQECVELPTWPQRSADFVSIPEVSLSLASPVPVPC